jgi:hypothetical protein
MYSPRVQKRPDIIAEFEALKRDIRIGIFGSYLGNHLTDLNLLQIFLKDNGYINTKLARDLEEDEPRGLHENEFTYAQRISDKLVDESYVHIFILFKENDGEHGINQSVLGEIRQAHTIGKTNIFLYHPLSVTTQVGSYYKRYFTDPPMGWKIDTYTSLKLKYEIILAELLEICNTMPPDL